MFLKNKLHLSSSIVLKVLNATAFNLFIIVIRNHFNILTILSIKVLVESLWKYLNWSQLFRNWASSKLNPYSFFWFCQNFDKEQKKVNLSVYLVWNQDKIKKSNDLFFPLEVHFHSPLIELTLFEIYFPNSTTIICLMIVKFVLFWV